MKPSIITLILALTGTLVFGQVELDKTYNFSGTLAAIDEGEYKYFVMDVPMEQCRIYNEDHSLFKTINLPVPDGYYLNDIKFVSRKTFNMDDEIELLYIYYKVEEIESQVIYTYGLKVISESGTVLLSLADGGYAEVKQGTDGLKLLAYQYIFYDYYYLVNTNIYSLGGNVKSATFFPNAGLKVYPNPAENNIHIELDPATGFTKSQITISDISGRQMIRKPVPAGATEMNISTGNLPSGSYILNLASEHGTIASEIIEKR